MERPEVNALENHRREEKEHPRAINISLLAYSSHLKSTRREGRRKYLRRGEHFGDRRAEGAVLLRASGGHRGGRGHYSAVVTAPFSS